MDSSTIPLPPGPVPVQCLTPTANALNTTSPEASSLQPVIFLFSTVYSILYTLTIFPFVWILRSFYSLISTILLHPLYSILYFVFSWIIWPLNILKTIFDIFEPLTIFFTNALVIGLFAGAAIAVAASSLTFLLGFMVPQNPAGEIPKPSSYLLLEEQERSRDQQLQGGAAGDPKRSRTTGAAKSDNSKSDSDLSSSSASSFESDDDLWNPSSLRARAARGAPVSNILPAAPGKTKQQKVVVGLLNETIHEEDSNSDIGG